LLHAEAHAPFAKSKWVALRTGDGAEIWYWDADRLPTAATLATPETVWRQLEDGWRIQTCIDGYEAQYVEGGVLLASTWRREPFERAHWASFVASVDMASAVAPETPPAALPLRFAKSQWRSRIIKAPLGWRDLEQGAAIVAASAIALSFFFLGQAVRHDGRTASAMREADAVQSRLTSDPDLRRARERRELGREVAEVLDALPVAGVLADSLSVFDRFEVEPRSLAIEDGQFLAVIDQPARPVRELVDQLESAGLCAVTPEIAGAGIVAIRAVIKPRAQAACNAAGVDE
jgi:hypothetical protein